eukprot:CAMPEP_0195512574 /NCGR_PEP_ID=MMETSP0794_2-20130614/4488_1 /TAXON_ID=515487 /ORGANISM="Stephanopyxis turris, Strain CCMP 815" /LENGTH=50 /DNA_ID=CAMNT_0040640385 /DNA_START=177 /DNA_END=326 /DNA_ORIENTATION=+
MSDNISAKNTACLVAHETVPDESMGDLAEPDMFDVDFKKLLEDMVVDKGL